MKTNRDVIPRLYFRYNKVMIKAIVFDVNGVLQRPSFRHFFPYVHLSPKELYTFFRLSRSASFKKANLGEYKTREELVDALCHELPQYSEAIRRVYKKRWEYYFTEWNSSVKILRNLAKEYDIYLLSNQSASEKEHILSYPFVKLVKGVFFSCDHHRMKPDPACFEAFLKEYDLKAKECLFIDDSAKNIAVAKQLGFIGLRKDLFFSDRIVRELLDKTRECNEMK